MGLYTESSLTFNSKGNIQTTLCLTSSDVGPPSCPLQPLTATGEYHVVGLFMTLDRFVKYGAPEFVFKRICFIVFSLVNGLIPFIEDHSLMTAFIAVSGKSHNGPFLMPV